MNYDIRFAGVSDSSLWWRRMGVLAAIASNIATTETNIEHVAVDERDGDASTLVFDLQVRDRKHLAHVIKNLRKMPEVLRVTRMLA